MNIDNIRDNCVECPWFEDCDGLEGECVYDPTLPNKPTNGDVIKFMFPDAKIILASNFEIGFQPLGENWIIWCKQEWWNKPFKGENVGRKSLKNAKIEL